jgi:hypothetical protein
VNNAAGRALDGEIGPPAGRWQYFAANPAAGTRSFGSTSGVGLLTTLNKNSNGHIGPAASASSLSKVDLFRDPLRRPPVLRRFAIYLFFPFLPQARNLRRGAEGRNLPGFLRVPCLDPAEGVDRAQARPSSDAAELADFPRSNPTNHRCGLEPMFSSSE